MSLAKPPTKLFPSLQLPLPQMDLQVIMGHLAHNTERRTYPLWQDEECLCFVARGREYRSEFHINPSHELQYSIKRRSAAPAPTRRTR